LLLLLLVGALSVVVVLIYSTIPPYGCTSHGNRVKTDDGQSV
jgi:hypothetical protein